MRVRGACVKSGHCTNAKSVSIVSRITLCLEYRTDSVRALKEYHPQSMLTERMKVYAGAKLYTWQMQEHLCMYIIRHTP